MKLLHTAHYNGCNYLSMMGLKLSHVSKRGHWWCPEPLYWRCDSVIFWSQHQPDKHRYCNLLSDSAPCDSLLRMWHLHVGRYWRFKCLCSLSLTPPEIKQWFIWHSWWLILVPATCMCICIKCVHTCYMNSALCINLKKIDALRVD